MSERTLSLALQTFGDYCSNPSKKEKSNIIKYLDIGLCSKQATICEEMNMLLGEIRRSQSDLQVSERTLSTALSAFADYSSNPSKKKRNATLPSMRLQQLLSMHRMNKNFC